MSSVVLTPTRHGSHSRPAPAPRLARVATASVLALSLTGLAIPLAAMSADAATTTLASDTFSRKVTGGWGTADTGGAWTVRGGSASQYADNGSAGTVALSKGNGLNADLLGVSAVNEDITATVMADKVATGGGNYVGLVARRHTTNELYAVNLTLASGTPTLQVYRRDSASAQVNLGSAAAVGTTAYTAKQQWRLRLSVSGTNPTTISAKAWPSSASEPSAWNIVATDSTAVLQSAGTPGFTTYLSTGATNAPVTDSVDGYTVLGTAVTVSLAQAPSTPTGLTASASDGQVALGWTAVSGATGYRVYRNGTQVANTTTTAYTATGLTNGTTYSFTVDATNSTGASAQSAPVSATPLPALPAAPTGLVASATDAQVALTWNAVAGATSYRVYRDGTAVATTTAASFADSGLTNGTTYSYAVAATNPAGTSAPSTTVTATPLPPIPSAPTGLTATAGNAQVVLAWTATTGATGYRVYRNGTQVATTGSPAFADSGLTNGTAYTYAVDATNIAGASAASAAVTATPVAPQLVGRTSLTAGAGPIGSAAYAVPSGAIIVATSGSDTTGTGSLTAPYATVAKALSVAPAGATIVVRAGTYHQDRVAVGTSVTIQSYPGEAVWFDGAAKVTSAWTSSGYAWATTYGYVFDHSPTYTTGAPDGTTSGWQWINPAYPMAAYPDQVWVNGVEQTQVGAQSSVTAGTFYVDTTSHLLYLGTNPAGATVEVSTYQQLFYVSASNVTLRGFGVKRYADSVPMSGVIVEYGTGTVLENVAVVDSATEGLGVFSSGDVLRHVTVTGSGLTGVHAWHADGLVMDGLDAEYNTDQHFNYSPVSGGFKAAMSRNMTLVNSILSHNYGQGAWFDCSIYNMTIANDDFVANAANGLATEISNVAVVANNVFTNNGGDGYRLDNTGNVTIWNNTFTNNAAASKSGRNLNVNADSRVYSCSQSGADTRFCPAGDPLMQWWPKNLSIRNNIYKDTKGDALFAVEDYTFTYTGQQLNISSDNNEYVRTGTTPSWSVIWSAGSGNNHNPYVYTTLAAFVAAQGQDTHSVASDNGAALPTPTPVALTSTLAPIVGRSTGELHIGAWS